MYDLLNTINDPRELRLLWQELSPDVDIAQAA